MKKLAHLRTGDVVVGRGVVQEMEIEWNLDTIQVERPALRLGDIVSWHGAAGSERQFGTVLGIDSEPGGSGVYVWIRQRGTWPRITKAATELRRETRAGGADG